MRRSKVLTSLIAVASLAPSVVLLSGASQVSADTASPSIQNESWFARFKPEDPQVNPPPEGCPHSTTTVPVPPTVPGCGPVSPADFPAPQSKSTGHYVVASRGGDIGDHDAGADTAWAAFQWDLLEYEGATADKFVVTLFRGIDNGGRNRGDTYPERPAEIQACNILEAWSGEAGSNPWVTKPKPSAECIVPTASADKKSFTFDVTTFANAWLEGKGFGFVIRPGTPTTKTVQPFQLTFAGEHDPGSASDACAVTAGPPCTTTPAAPEPIVTFQYTPAVEEDLFADIDDGSGGEFFEDVTSGGDAGVLEAVPDLDVIPTDVGSEPDPGAPGDVAVGATGTSELAAPTARRRTAPISAETGFPWIVLLLLPIMAIAFWGTGTALGAAGDPVPARSGGVSRVLAERHAANGGSNFQTRNGR